MINSIGQFLESGGPVMVPIALVSVAGIALVLERAAATQAQRAFPSPLKRELEAYVNQRRWDDMRAACHKYPSAYGRLAVIVIENRLESRETVKALLEEEGRQQVAKLDRGLSTLATMANVSPMLGLVGTVWGMILTFDAIQREGMGSIAGLAGGISQALITTLAGLCVGIPLLLAHRWLAGRVDALTMQLEQESLQLLTLVKQDKE